ncbi:phytanoyl-CoA dioxygenase family protein [Horticoccus luteus]|uniref:Phytanoyl-CoA dioxygenase family protein n=1 Tax=Horticoccus luteus TaxID=2862869 RepID=A0A8F9TVW8_9BACT|nr:phytanoyl-CoA dioxygenase family protein [Horticoccus luteus]QYM78739.1 phytanoyl-CoA dioxygenase family protein [Horticoccus luteus]
MTASIASAAPSATQRFHFDTQGYLVVEDFLAPDHVQRLRSALAGAIERRRRDLPAGWKAVWPPRNRHDLTQVHGAKSTRILNILEDDPLFLELLTWPALVPFVHAFCNPQPHYHASDAIVEDAADFAHRADGWHIDGSDNGYRNLGGAIPLLQLKVGYYLTDMTEPFRGNLTLVPGSHLSRAELGLEDRRRREFFPGAKQICAPAGSLILFHNAIWHTASPYADGAPGRQMLYYAYEHPWMMASTAHWGYSKAFYNDRLTPEQRGYFHGFVFDPPELR